MPLEAVLANLNNRYAIRIACESIVFTKQCKFTITGHTRGANDSLIIAKTINTCYEFERLIQLEEMDDRLRNSLWNVLYQLIFDVEHMDYAEREEALEFLAAEFFRIPMDEVPSRYENLPWFKKLFFNKKLPWYGVYNLMEFVAQNISIIRPHYGSIGFMKDVNRILEEEMSGYRFINGELCPISNKEELGSIESSIQAARDKQLFGTSRHIETAISLIAKKPNPDYRNSIKESISAIESLAKQITGEETGGLKDALNKLDEKIHFHGAFKEGLLKLYGYSSDEDGIRHAILEEPNLGYDEAKFMLVSCSAFVHFIISKATKHGLL